MQFSLLAATTLLSVAVSAQAEFLAIAPINADSTNPLFANISGYVSFAQEEGSNAQIYLSISGLPANSIHGFHVHAKPVDSSDASVNNCTTAAGHFNPGNRTHGDIKNDEEHRHYGDLGNVQADGNGQIALQIDDYLVSLFGEHPVQGLALVLHEKVDDLGLGGVAASKLNGNAGARVACGNIIAFEL